MVAEEKVFGKLGELKAIKDKRNIIIAIGGCMMQEEGMVEKIKKSYPFVNVIFGTHTLQNLPENIYKAIIENILGKTVVAEDIDSATAIAKKFAYRIKIVTLDGQVLNAGGSHRDIGMSTENYIPPLCNAVISIRGDISVDEVVLQPENIKLDTYKEGSRTCFKIPRVDIHSIAHIRVK